MHTKISPILLVTAVINVSIPCRAFINPALQSSSVRRQGQAFRETGVAIRSRSFRLRHGQDGAVAESELRVEDRDVPIAHAGLHDFLYGAEEDHGASSKSANDAELFDGSRAHSVTEWLKKYEGSKHAAVYSVVAAAGHVSFVGVTRNAALSLACHLKNEGPNKVALVKLRSFRYPKRAEMDEAKETMLKALDYVPEGNKPGNEWAQTIKDAAGSLAGDALTAHEESKLKMRMAMADTTLIDESEQLSGEEIYRRKNLQNAVEGDDWSGLIDAQTAATVKPKAQEQIEQPKASAVTTPAELMTPSTPAPSECRNIELTVDNVDKVLDEVRPYLIADGGNCRVVSVDLETRSVSLALQGACGSCPSSTMTMQMGIERVLKENFENLGEVIRVDDATSMAMAQVTNDVVEALLAPIRTAIKAMNGKVEVRSAVDGVVTLAYSGSPKIKYGIDLALRDNPLVSKVIFVEF